jgi:hypothetical protein
LGGTKNKREKEVYSKSSGTHRFDPELVLNEPELEALEPRPRAQVVAELVEVQRSHGLQDEDVIDQQLPAMATARGRERETFVI